MRYDVHMKIPRILLVMLIVFGIAAPFAVGAQQAPRTQHGHHANFFRQGLNRIGLSAEQHQQIRSIFQQFRASHPQGSHPGKAAQKQLHQNILAVLTPQQKQQLHAFIRSHHQHKANVQGSPLPNGSPFPNGSPLPNPFASGNP